MHRQIVVRMCRNNSNDSKNLSLGVLAMEAVPVVRSLSMSMRMLVSGYQDVSVHFIGGAQVYTTVAPAFVATLGIARDLAYEASIRNAYSTAPQST